MSTNMPDRLQKRRFREEAATRVFVLCTGGTIEMVPGAEGQKPGDADALSLYLRKADREIWWDIEGLTDEKGLPVGPLESSVGPDHD